MSKLLCPQCKNERNIQKGRSICSGCRTFNNRVRRGEVLPPTAEGLTTEGYKEPMVKVENGFGFYGAMTRSADEMMVQCHICGYLFSHLGAHTRMAHGVSAAEYKLKFGLRRGDGLVGRGERQRLQEVYGNHLRKYSMANLAKAHQAAKAKRQAGWTPGGDTWTAQLRNERGLCKEQTLAKLKHIAEINDNVITQPLFEQTYGTSMREVAIHWFGSWNEAVKAAGGETTYERMNRLADDQVDATIERMVEFYEKFGRTPQTADFNSENGLPPARWVTKHFGGMNKARAAAGIPVLVSIGNGVWREFMPDDPKVKRNGRIFVYAD